MATDGLDGIAMFVRAGTAGSFVGAARVAGVTPSAVSKAVSRLETRLGVRLFHRSTHAIRLTDEGAAFFARCQGALAEIEAAEAMLADRRGAGLRGRLRISASVPVAAYVLGPILPRFADHHPELAIEVVATDRISDLVEEAFDLAFRTGTLSDAGLTARKLFDTRMVVAGSPDYFERRGWPKRPDDLAAHDRLGFVFPQTGRRFEWRFGGAEPVVMAPSARFGFSDAPSMIAAAEAGGGLIFLQDYILSAALRSGRLIEVLREFSADGGPVSAVWTGGRMAPPRVRALVDFIVPELLGRNPG